MINKAYYQQEQPTEPFTDAYEVPLRVGAKVAYNQAGGVRLGIITKWEAKWKAARKGVEEKQWWSLDAKVWILEQRGHSSLLRNLNGLVILD